MIRSRRREWHSLVSVRKRIVVARIIIIEAAGVAQEDAGEDKEDGEDDELEDPEGDEDALEPHLVGRGGHGSLLCERRL